MIFRLLVRVSDWFGDGLLKVGFWFYNKIEDAELAESRRRERKWRERGR